MPLILSIATSSLHGSVALLERTGGRWVSRSHAAWNKTESHSEQATLSIEELLKRESLDWSQVQGLAVCVGPGSFTGVRVGINVVRAVSFLLGVPVLAVSSLRLAAEPALDQGLPVAVALNAQRNEIFAAVFRGHKAGVVEELAPRCMSPEEFERLRPSGAVFLNDPEVTALQFAQVMNREPDLRPTLQWREVLPLYLRASAAEEKLRSGELRPFQKR